MKKQKTTRVFIDQYGSAHYTKTLTELRARIGGRLSKMYIDDKNGEALHIGYVIGALWLTEYTRKERD
jgi:hypothetical protein